MKYFLFTWDVNCCACNIVFCKRGGVFNICRILLRQALKLRLPWGACCLAVIILTGCSGSEQKSDDSSHEGAPPQEIVLPEPQFQDGHTRMLGVLKEHAERIANEHPIMGRKRVLMLRQQIEKLKNDAPRGMSRMQIAGQYSLLGQSEMWQGNLDQALSIYNNAFDLIKALREENKIPQTINMQISYTLGLAHMRRGETRNCCQRNSPDSCLLPIRGKGIHIQQEDSKQAIKYFSEVLEKMPKNSPMYLKAKWLLNIMYMTIDGYPDEVPKEYLIQPRVFESEELFARFTNVASKLGVDTFNLAGGVIIDDFTGDGYFDIVVSTFDFNGQMHFFRNNRDGSFTDRTEEANLTGLVGGINMTHADYDNDGDLDILILRGGWSWMGDDGKIPNSLLRNNGEGRFTDVTFSAGLGEVHYPTQTATWADYDKDGDLDIYIGNESSQKQAPCQLFQNNGNGTFTDVARKAGVLNLGYTKGVAWGDYNDDGFPDLYVSNLGSANRLFRNNGDGTFVDVAQQVGVTGPIKSFPIWFWDYDNDGVLDLYVANYDSSVGGLAEFVANRLGLPIEGELARLYRGDGRGGFEEVAKEQNLTRVALPMGVNYGDLDNDGYLDFYLGTGYPDYEALMPNVMYRNRGGTGFSDVTSAGGFGHLQKGHGIAFADLDNDGDQDIFEQMGGFFPGDKYYDSLFENPGFGNHWISIKLIGVRSNRSAIGARIHLQITEGGKQRSIYKHVNSGGSFGGNPLRQTIGLGKAQKIEMLQVYWPTTKQTQTFRDLSVDQFIQITEGSDQYKPLELKKLKLGSQ